jgi:selenocysteine-specific elongation factor
VTGTAWSGRVREGDAVVVLPAGLEARVRSAQVHGEKRQEAFAGERVALNLHGPKSGEVERGMLVATPGVLQPSYMLDVTLHLLPSWSRALANRARLRVHYGAAEVLGRVVLLDRDALEPGQSAPAQLRLESPVAADRGDRLVLRQYSPMHTLGGAVVLDPAPAKHKRFREDVLEAIAVRESGDPEDLVRDALRRAALAGASVSELRSARVIPEPALEPALRALESGGEALALGEAYYDTGELERTAHEVRRLASDFQRANPLAWGIGRAELQERLGHRGARSRFGELLDGLAHLTGGRAELPAAPTGAAGAETKTAAPGGTGSVRIPGEPIRVRPDAVRVGTPDRELAPADRAALAKLEALLRDAGAAPPAPGELQAQLAVGTRFAAFVGLLEEQGAVVKVGDSLLYHRAALDAIEAKLRTHLESHDVMSMGEFKELTGLSRKYSVPLLEHFDRRGLTARKGDNRVPGPGLRRSTAS